MRMSYQDLLMRTPSTPSTNDQSPPRTPTTDGTHDSPSSPSSPDPGTHELRDQILMNPTSLESAMINEFTTIQLDATFRDAPGPHVPGEPSTCTPIPFPPQAPSATNEGWSPPTPRSPRTQGDLKGVGRYEPQPMVDGAPAPQHSILHEILPEPLCRSQPLANFGAIHQLSIDLNFSLLPISLWLESSQPLSHVSYYPDDADTCFKIHFTD